MFNFIGLTGTICSGKSTVSKILEEEYGAVIIDADKICRDLSEPGQIIYASLALSFTAERKEKVYFNEDQTLNRKALAKLMFTDRQAKTAIEGMMHTHVKREMVILAGQAFIENQTESLNRPIVFDAPLLIEAGLHELVNTLLVVHIDGDLQLQRLMKRNGYSEEEAKTRINAMTNQKELLSHADYVIDNNGDTEALRKQIRGVMSKIGF